MKSEQHQYLQYEWLENIDLVEIFSTLSEQELAHQTETEESLAFVCQPQMIKCTLCVLTMQLTLKLYLVGHIN